MIKNYSDIPATYGLAGTNLHQAESIGSTSADIVSSFKEILSTMMLPGVAPASDSQSAIGASDLMAPLMLMLLEKMIALQMEQTTPAANGLLAQSEPQGRPVSGVLTQDYHPGHNGLDFGIAEGTPIKTTMDGQVISAGWNNQGYGNLVIVENGATQTYYAHLSSIPVAVGDKVSAGSVIGLSGNTGRSTGPHLHYEIRKNNIPIDPTSVTLGVSG